LTGLSAQQGLAQAEQAVAMSDDQISADQITLFLALGGGWE
jgi:outer membrane protein TolC